VQQVKQIEGVSTNKENSFLMNVDDIHTRDKNSYTAPFSRIKHIKLGIMMAII